MSNVPRLQQSSRLIGGFVLALLLSSTAWAETAPPAPPPLAGEAHSSERQVLATGTTVTGEPIRYPAGAPARVTAVEITLAPGHETGWHLHPVPLFGRI